jgi:hypothetical protein
MKNLKLYLLATALGGMMLMGAAAQRATAGPQTRSNLPKVVIPGSNPATLPGSTSKYLPQTPNTRPIGWDWWRTYPWSPYNAWRNPYWYPPYNPNYPYPPDQAYPYPYPPVPPVPPVPPWGSGIGSPR